MIAVVDYGMGNLRSLSNALESLGAEVVLASSADDLHRSERIVLPGVGAFGDAARALRQRGLADVLSAEVVRGSKPLLGICLGMQLLARTSSEHGMHHGLGWIDADVVRLPTLPGIKVPHVGWNSVRFEPGDWLFRGIRPGESNFYFVHSFHMSCRAPADVVGTSEHGIPFTAAVRSGNVVATQFHPEKSQDNGMRLLSNWLAWEPAC
jgi:glutamine amidotransferase